MQNNGANSERQPSFYRPQIRATLVNEKVPGLFGGTQIIKVPYVSIPDTIGMLRRKAAIFLIEGDLDTAEGIDLAAEELAQYVLDGYDKLFGGLK